MAKRPKGAPSPAPESEIEAADEPKKGLAARTLQSESRKLAEQALSTLAKIMKGEGQDSVRLAAAREVLDRGYGRTKLGAADRKAEGGGPYTVVVQRFSDPPDPKLEDFE
jgi:hypothetical protein